MMYAFPHKQYCLGGSTSGFRLDAFAHAVSISDVVKDTIHVFAPSYSDYVLYSDGGPAEHVKRKKYRGQKGGLEPPKPNVVRQVLRHAWGPGHLQTVLRLEAAVGGSETARSGRMWCRSGPERGAEATKANHVARASFGHVFLEACENGWNWVGAPSFHTIPG